MANQRVFIYSWVKMDALVLFADHGNLIISRQHHVSKTLGLGILLVIYVLGTCKEKCYYNTLLQYGTIDMYRNVSHHTRLIYQICQEPKVQSGK